MDTHNDNPTPTIATSTGWDEAYFTAEAAYRADIEAAGESLPARDKEAANELLCAVADIIDAAKLTARGAVGSYDTRSHLADALKAIARAGALGAPVPPYDMAHRIRQQREDMEEEEEAYWAAQRAKSTDDASLQTWGE